MSDLGNTHMFSTMADESLNVMFSAMLDTWASNIYRNNRNDEFLDEGDVADVGRGDVVIYSLPNETATAVRFLRMIAAGASVLAMPPEMSQAVRSNLRSVISATVVVEDGVVKRFGDATTGSPRNVLSLTSGSTGDPKIVSRSLSSHLAEAERYRTFLNLSPKDHILLPVPICHSYALGWLFACVLSQACTEIVSTTSLTAIAAAMKSRASVVALVPALARLLATRTRRNQKTNRLRVAMVGAGPVDEALDHGFKSAFGLGLARNYGSTETGAVLAGLEDTPIGFVGVPLPGIFADIRHPVGGESVSGSEVGRLWVQADGEAWHDTCDLAIRTGDGAIRIVGRADNLFRRGHRFVSPVEIEDALRDAMGVRDVVVKSIGKKDGNDVIVAVVVPAKDGSFDSAQAMVAIREHLGDSNKVPDKVIPCRSLRRGANGKLVAEPRYYMDSFQKFSNVIQLYKVSELLFALDDLSVIEMLTSGATVTEICFWTDLEWDAVDQVIKLLEATDVLSETAKLCEPSLFADVLSMEKRLSKSLCSREGIADRLRGTKCPDRYVPTELGKIYRQLIGGRGARAHADLAIHRLRRSRQQFRRVLEISGGDSVYLPAIQNRLELEETRLLRCGVFQAYDDFPRPVTHEIVRCGGASGSWDLIILNNALRAREVFDPIELIRASTAAGATVVVDDLFVSRNLEGACYTVDWLAAGSAIFPYADDFVNALEIAGLRAKRIGMLNNTLREVYQVEERT